MILDSYSLYILVGMILNTLVLVTAHRNLVIKESGKLQILQILQKDLKWKLSQEQDQHPLPFVHLTIADTLVTFIPMQLEADWRFTQQVGKSYKDNPAKWVSPRLLLCADSLQINQTSKSIQKCKVFQRFRIFKFLLAWIIIFPFLNQRIKIFC